MSAPMEESVTRWPTRRARTCLTGERYGMAARTTR